MNSSGKSAGSGGGGDPEQPAASMAGRTGSVRSTPRISPSRAGRRGGAVITAQCIAANLELDTAFLLLDRPPDSDPLTTVGLEGLLDYVATGLPRAGDVIGGEYRSR